ncbi:hypothetical protein [Flavobacterium xueshanense]|uniref:Uncharacterized protein n=1 Tax=Flavobacterium xueshanense TaxID=935223 RepID=A0A1I2HCA8_9FLAO|nr:hypothetical protein [Flavobacterium xueshanense]SFF26940.1 hypothetical protein SAMN04488131_11352 [Flavobacterium xueshanense]
MGNTAPERQSGKPIKAKNNTTFLYIGTFFFFAGSLSVGILMVIFFLNALGNVFQN